MRRLTPAFDVLTVDATHRVTGHSISTKDNGSASGAMDKPKPSARPMSKVNDVYGEWCSHCGAPPTPGGGDYLVEIITGPRKGIMMFVHRQCMQELERNGR